MTPTNQHDTGVTLGMLLPYLEKDIEVAVPMSGYRGTLKAAGRYGGVPSVSLYVESRGGHCHHHPSHCLPVLWGYEDILTKLPDDTIPAYEYVRQLFPNQKELRHQVYGDIIEVWGSTALYMWQKKNFEAGEVSFSGANYLRDLGFAVGFQPQHFIRKTA